MFENIRLVYKHYGGVKSILTSTYFWLAAITSFISFDSVYDLSWVDTALGSIPSLTGFTIAAFAILFAILRRDQFEKLLSLDSSASSPVLQVTSSISHAVVIQVFAMVFAMLFRHAEFEPISAFISSMAACPGFSKQAAIDILTFIETVFSTMGLFFTHYGVILVLAAALSVFRLQLLVASAMPNKTQSKGRDKDAE